jgi:hypothetical protein
LSSVFCSSTSCGWISTLKRRDVWNSRSSTWPSEMSFSGRSKCGSQTARIAPFELVDAGRRRHPAALDVQLGDALVVARKKAMKFCARYSLSNSVSVPTMPKSSAM